MQTLSQLNKRLIIYKNHVPDFSITGSTFHVQSKLSETEIELNVTITESRTAYLIYIPELPELEETTNLVIKNGSASIYNEIIHYVS